MHDFREQYQTVFHAKLRLSLFSLKQCKIKQFIVRLGFCDIWNNQGGSECYQLITLTLSLIIPDITLSLLPRLI